MDTTGLVSTSPPTKWFVFLFSLHLPMTVMANIGRPVTPGNRGAAVVAGFNVIVFATIAVLAHREKVQQKRNGELHSPADTEIHSRTNSNNASSKKNLSSNVKTVEI
jgi:ACS family pantothenate transporter-like MFS transporter